MTLACLHPITIRTKTGLASVGCKQCLNCRILRQSELTASCLLEDMMASSAHFLTLTYASAPERGGYEDLSKYLKRLHAKEMRLTGSRTIRYLGVGEYGHKHGRFHYHALIWNTPPAMVDLLTEQWPHGFVKVGTVTPASVRYTARYTLKFDTKGEEAVAGWSKKPALGASGIRAIAAKMRDDPKQRYHAMVSPSVAPRLISIQGKSWPLKPVLGREFMREFWDDPHWEPSSSSVYADIKHNIDLILGDPVEKQRKAQHSRQMWLESAKLAYGQF